MKSKKTGSEGIMSNMAWRLGEKWGCQFVSFVVTIIIARILEPAAYGPVAIVNAFISIFNVFVDSGLGNSLIQNKDADDADFSTAFFANTFICSLVYFVLFVSSSFIATYYKMPILKPLLRVSGITLLVSGLKNVQEAYVSKKLMFKKFFFASLFGTVGAGVIGVWMALRGYGVWSLVISHVFDVVCDTIFIWFSISWHPTFTFSFEKLKKLYSYGWKLFASAILNKLYKKAYQLVIGKIYTSTDLAYYDKGETISNKITNSIDSMINSVLFPVLAKEQENENKLREISKRTMQVNFFVMTPLLIGLAAVSKTMVSVLLTDKWLPAVPFIQIYCLINVTRPIHTTNLTIIKSVGRSDLFLKLEIYKKIVEFGILFLTIKSGPLIMAYGLLMCDIISIFINGFNSKELIDYSIIRQLIDLSPTLICGVLMGAIVLMMNNLQLNGVLLLGLQIIAGAIVYIMIAFILRNDILLFLLKSIKKGKYE